MLLLVKQAYLGETRHIDDNKESLTDGVLYTLTSDMKNIITCEFDEEPGDTHSSDWYSHRNEQS